MCSGTLRKISIIAFFRRHGKDLAPGLKHGANTGRRQSRVADHARDPFKLRPCPWKITGNLDVELLRPAVSRVEEMYIAGLLVNYGVRPGRGRHHVKIIMPRYLRDLLCVRAIGVEVGDAAVAVRQKVD